MEHKSYLYSMMGCNDGECRRRCLPRKREELAGRREELDNNNANSGGGETQRGRLRNSSNVKIFTPTCQSRV